MFDGTPISQTVAQYHKNIHISCCRQQKHEQRWPVGVRMPKIDETREDNFVVDEINIAPFIIKRFLSDSALKQGQAEMSFAKQHQFRT